MPNMQTASLGSLFDNEIKFSCTKCRAEITITTTADCVINGWHCNCLDRIRPRRISARVHEEMAGSQA